MFRFCINRSQLLQARGPMAACWLQSSSKFRTRAGRESFGLGSTLKNEQDYDSKMSEFYQDNKMQKLWNNTFERISTFQNVRQQQTQPQQTQATGGAATAGKPNLRGISGGNTTPMFSIDDQQMMKLSFAEGYFYGRENKKKSRFRILAVIREATIIFIIIAVIYSLTNGENPFKRAMLGRTFEIQPEEIDVSFSDVKGCDESKQELADIVEFLKRPAKFSRLGGKLPKGVLLVGPPGTGKTLLARAVAGEAGVPFFHAAGSEFDEILVGQGARRVRDLFDKAKQRTPCVIFIDEIDSIGGKRSSSMFHPYANQTVNQLLSEMDGFNQNEGVIVIGATNRANDLDKALVRPGRFDVQVTVPVPDYKGRKELFDHYLSKVRASRDIDIDTLCRTTVGFTGADIENLVNQGALKSATDNMDIVTQDSLEFARDKILMGPERRNRLPDKEQNLMTAYHEGGHALVAYYTEKANSLHKVTIVSRGNSLGHTSTLPERDLYSQTKEQLSATIDVMLGGRVAEELIYGSDRVTTGCEDDLRKANMLATRMVKDFGMSDKIGMRVVRDDETQTSSQVVINNFSDATSELVESEISKLLNESKERVRKILTERRNELVLLAEALLKYETLDASEVKLVIEGKDPKILRQERDRERRNRLNNLKVGNPPDRLPLDLLK
uniref:ATP-dependent zinc metalloprotease YME1 n=1 Tax=Aceria tosichella TaxID=561515 RepID=A0A6G1SC33_9ACAR